MIDLIERLSLLKGVSGDEAAVAEFIMKEIDGHCEYHIDNVGNLLVLKKGAKRPKKKVLLAAHMDEVGFIITYIDDSGLLKFSTVGGIDSRVIIGKSVLVGDNGVYGVIGARPVHLLEAAEKDKVIETDALYIDIGAKDKAEAEQYVRMGDRAVYDSDFVHFGDGMIKARALDDRAGCAILIDMIKGELEYDTWFAFTVQEEIGTVGAKTAAFAADPDCAIVVETTTAGDVGGVPDAKKVCSVGKGPVVGFMDRGTIYDSGLYQLAMEIGSKENIPVQTKEGVYGGNDSRSIQCSRGGVRCIAVSMPCRYLHSPSCVLKITDIEHTRALVARLSREMSALD
ncbi:M42 family peptidase [Hydrogenoanaerobacterium sp.]|uniref:M42 family metallopeptidase n=1 Tax=Hydrogenoanaerobacterium sp. TaxID=2953763 RepID=UPI00289E9510|nr:M42 family peptidase [Hydrogenoanaerobacterium sp.]